MSITQLLTTHKSLDQAWVSAHWDKKLTRGTVLKHHIEDTVRKLISESKTLSLQNISKFLYGIVKILHKKAQLLNQDLGQFYNNVQARFKHLNNFHVSTTRKENLSMSDNGKTVSILTLSLTPRTLFTSIERSIEIPRQIAPLESITLQEYEQEMSLRKVTTDRRNTEMFEFADNFLEDIAQSVIGELDMDIDQLSVSNLDYIENLDFSNIRDQSLQRKVPHFKYKWRPDQQTETINPIVEIMSINYESSFKEQLTYDILFNKTGFIDENLQKLFSDYGQLNIRQQRKTDFVIKEDKAPSFEEIQQDFDDVIEQQEYVEYQKSKDDIKQIFESSNQINFNQLFSNTGRANIAKQFSTVLELANKEDVLIKQEGMFLDILITKY